jgi:hypothetical protein
VTQNRRFLICRSGQSISALGDAFAFVAVPLRVLEASGAGALVGAVTPARTRRPEQRRSAAASSPPLVL